MRWHPVEAADIDALRQAMGPLIGALAGPVTFRRRRLSFYSKGSMVVAFDRAGAVGAVQSDHGTVIPLDGSRAALDQAAVRCGLHLRRNTVAAYVEFYCVSIALNRAVFPVLKALPDGQRVARSIRPEAVPLKVGRRRDGEAFRLVGHCLHMGQVYRCAYRVDPDGHVRMKHDRNYGPLLTVQ